MFINEKRGLFRVSGGAVYEGCNGLYVFAFLTCFIFNLVRKKSRSGKRVLVVYNDLLVQVWREGSAEYNF